jgi:ATP synthase (C/AC39) subunit
MSGGWVAGTVRAKAMARRVLGAESARQLAACRSLADAQQLLVATPFRAAGDRGLSLAAAQHAVAATMLWDLRVLAGWLPRDGVALLRLLAGWFEIANVDELLRALTGLPAGPEFRLGALATAWPRLATARSMTELRRSLAASPWGDPGGDSIRDIQLGMRTRWGARVVASGDRARAWAVPASALLTASEPGAPALAAVPNTGRRSRRLPGGPLHPPTVTAPAAEPWQAEADWWRRVEADGLVLLRSAGPDSGPVLGAVIVLAADARRVRAALELAARGGAPVEAYDAVV